MITIKGYPDQFTPSFNPIYFYLDSDNKSEQGFKYVVDIYRTGTADLLASYKIYPRPNDGYGVADINQVLRSQISEDIAPIDMPRNIPNAHIDYDIEFGEEYIFEWVWTDTVTIVSGPFSGGNYTFVYSTGQTHNFVDGDFILMEQNPSTGFSYTGVYQIVSIFNDQSFIIDAPFVATTPVGGVAYFSDKRKSLFPDLTGFTGYSAFNGAVAHQQFMDYDSFDYNMMVNDDALFLTNMPHQYRVKPDNTMRLNFYSSSLSGAGSNISFQLLTQFGQYNIVASGATDGIMGVYNCGPDLDETDYINDFGNFPIFRDYCFSVDVSDSGGNALMTGFGESPWYNNFTDETVIFNGENGEFFKVPILDTPTPDSVLLDVAFADVISTYGHLTQRTDYYTLQFFSGNTPSSSAITINVDWNRTRYGNIELVFLDRLGSYVPANFELQNVKTMNVTRDSYKKILGDLNETNNRWEYASTGRGKTNINTQVIQVLDLTSNWLTEQEANYLKELYSSPLVYIKDNGQLWPVVVTTNTYQIQTKNNKKNIQIKITVEYANNDIINNVQ